MVQDSASGDNRHDLRKVSCSVSNPNLGALADFITSSRLSDSIRDQYSILERRLSEPGQMFIALPDRPTIVDFATLAFANERIASTASYDFSDWPNLMKWSERMLARPAVQRAFARAQTFGL